MNEQIGNGLPFQAFFSASKVGKTGLTPTVDVYRVDTAGAATTLLTGQASVAVGGGLYSYLLPSASVTAEGSYLAVFKTTDTTVDLKEIPGLWLVGKAGVEYLDASVSSRLASASYAAPPSASTIAAAVWDRLTSALTTVGSIGKLLVDRVDANVSSATAPTAAAVADAVWDEALSGHTAIGTAGGTLGLLGTGQVTVSTPVSSSAAIALVRGDDYAAADNRALEWTDASGTSWPDLTGAAIALHVRHRTLFTKAGAVVVASGAGKRVRVELTAAETAIGRGPWRYDLQATLASGRVVTLAIGALTVVEDVT